MNVIDPQELKSFLVQMQHEDPDLRVFGAIEHQYQLHPPLSEAAIRTFEMQYGITLPDEYRHFLSVIGHGGAGPYYGILARAEERRDHATKQLSIGQKITSQVSSPLRRAGVCSIPIW